MNLARYIFGSLFSVGVLAAGAVDHVIDAKDGVIQSDPSGDFIIGTDHGTGDGITLVDVPVVKIQSLSHDRVACDAVVKLALAQLLQFSSLKVSNATLSFYGIESAGIGSADDAWGNLYFDVTEDASVILRAPLSAGDSLPMIRLHKRGGGKVLAYEAFTATVTNEAGAVYFGSGDNGRGLLGLSSPEGFVFSADCNTARPSQLVVDSQQNGGRGVTSVLASCLTSDVVEINDLIISGGSDVEISSGLTLYDLEVVTDFATYTNEVPECAVVGSNAVGVLRVNGALQSKLVIADGSSANAKGAVYVGKGGSVTNYSATIGEPEPLLGRSGYACLDVAGEYVAFGGWLGAASGQLSLNVSGVFQHPDSAIRGGRFSLGGNDAYASVSVVGGLFDASGLASAVSLPYRSAAKGVVLSAEDDGVLNFGPNSFSVAEKSVVSLSDGGTLAASSILVTSPALIQLDGGYLRPTSGGALSSANVYAHSNGFGIDVPAEQTTLLDAAHLPAFCAGNGVSSIAVGSAVAGRKFVGPPIVTIQDGGGKGATAVAELQGGEVSSIRVTGRGVNYTSEPTAKLVYGTDEIELGKVTISENGKGPLLKRGDGVLEVDVQSDMDGLRIYGGTVKALRSGIVNYEGLLYMAEGTVFDADSTYQRFASYSGAGRILNGPVWVSSLVVDMNRAKAGDVDTLDLSQVKLADGAGIKLTNVTDLDRISGRYVIYRLNGDMPKDVPSISEETYKTEHLSRGWKVKVEGNEFVLRYVGGSIYIFY